MFRPLLAPQECMKTLINYLEDLPYPLLMSPKYDGIRALPKNDRVKSRSFKDIPSNQVQDMFSMFDDMDGELIVGSPVDEGVYNRTQSHVMSKNKPADLIRLFVFDWTKESAAMLPFHERLAEVTRQVNSINTAMKAGGHPQILVPVPHKRVNNIHELLEVETANLELGFEGSMGRSMYGRYKHGRATYNDQIIYKFKRSSDEEGTIVDFIEGETNLNEKTVDDLGYAERSDHKANKVPNGRVGKFVLLWNGHTIVVAAGMHTHAELEHMWNNKEMYRGLCMKWRHFEHGVKDLPRHGRAIGLRDPIDM
jgi:DNA ligase-1